MSALHATARRVWVLEEEAAEREKAIRAIVVSWRPDLLTLTGVGPIVAATVLTAWSHAGRCRDDGAFAPSRCWPAPPPSRHRRERRCATGSTAPAIDSSTVRSTRS
jgi:hypothetical protein